MMMMMELENIFRKLRNFLHKPSSKLHGSIREFIEDEVAAK
jgi:hypothetical protein